MTTKREIKKILDGVLKKIKPTKEQREYFEKLGQRTLYIANQEAAGLNAKAILAGSLTRDTWLLTKNEFDIFIIFPKTLKEEQLEGFGLEIGKTVINRLGGEWRIEYAQHPYVRGFVGETQIDIVPCYEIKAGEKIKSAVDRTPFHVEYLERHFPIELSDEVRLLKQFLKSNGTYGADTKTEGFSGYICELLIINYGTFFDVLNAVNDWKAGEIIDPEGLWDEKNYRRLRRKFKDQVLIVIDPVDKDRNAAAAVSAQSFFKFKKITKSFLEKPREELFFEKPKKPFSVDELIAHLTLRGTDLIFVKFKSPDVVPDILWPQLRRTTKRFEGVLREYEFEVLRSDCWSCEKDLAVILLEMEISKLPPINKRIGPSVFDRDDSENFIKKYEKDALVGPFIEGNNWCVEVKREWRKAVEKLKDSLKGDEVILKANGIPNYVAKEIAQGFEIIENESISKLIGESKEFAIFLREYFEKEKLSVR